VVLLIVSRVLYLFSFHPGKVDPFERESHLAGKRCQDAFLLMGDDAIRFGGFHAENT
jgi:hypothetical protein